MHWQDKPDGSEAEPVFSDSPDDQKRQEQWGNITEFRMLRDAICSHPAGWLNAYHGDLATIMRDVTDELRNNGSFGRSAPVPRFEAPDDLMALGALDQFFGAFTRLAELGAGLEQELAATKAQAARLETQLTHTQEFLEHAEVWLSGYVYMNKVYKRLDTSLESTPGISTFLAHRARKGEGTEWNPPDGAD